MPSQMDSTAKLCLVWSLQPCDSIMTVKISDSNESQKYENNIQVAQCNLAGNL